MDSNISNLKKIVNDINFQGQLPILETDIRTNKLYNFSIIPNGLTSQIMEVLPKCKGKIEYIIGCFLGLAIGMSSALPYEFNKIRSSHLQLENKSIYYDFQLGQLPSDFSFTLALAESLLAEGHYNSHDIKLKWCYYWYQGYCSRIDPHLTNTRNYGNTVAAVINYKKNHKSFVKILANDTNETLCRLAPIAIFWNNNIEKAIYISQLHTFASHGTEISSIYSALITFILVNLINISPTYDRTFINLKTTLDNLLKNWLNIYNTVLIKHPDRPSNNYGDLLDGISDMIQICTSSPENSLLNENWNWKLSKIDFEQIITNRKQSNRPFETFGEKSSDVVALAFHIIYNSNSVSDLIYKGCVQGGDADNITGIACQITGAFFGYSYIYDNPYLKPWNNLLEKWDKKKVIILACCLFIKSENKSK